MGAGSDKGSSDERGEGLRQLQDADAYLGVVAEVREDKATSQTPQVRFG